jgi:SIR2-like domain/TIR domain
VGDVDRQFLGEGEPRVATVSERRLHVFINYRNDDYPGVAWPLYLQMTHQLPDADVFFDNVALKPGTTWFDEIRSHAIGASVFLALIGPRWFDCLTERMHRGGDDYVVKEIDLALRGAPQVTVIPVLVDGAQLPGAADLPPALRALPGRQVARIRHRNLLEDVNNLLSLISELGSEGRGAEAQDRAAPDGLGGESDAATPPAVAVDRTPAGESAPAAQLVAAPDREHFEMVINKAANLVVFLGAGANADEREGQWDERSGLLPDDGDLARYLAVHAGMTGPTTDLAAVAQYARAIHGPSELFDWLNQTLRLGDGATPGRVHTWLASLPQRLEVIYGTKRYQLIVTPKYDAALERAFRQAGEPFDVLVYMGPGTEGEGWFKHFPWDGEAQTISEPNSYFGLPIDRERRQLMRSVIVRINGAVDDGQDDFPEDNFIITEDNYIDYLSGRPAAQVVPTQILATLRRANYLFLGYAISDWRLRVFLHRVWEGPQLGGQNYWAVQRQPDRLDSRLWTQAGVTHYQASLVDYMGALCQAIERQMPK